MAFAVHDGQPDVRGLGDSGDGGRYIGKVAPLVVELRIQMLEGDWMGRRAYSISVACWAQPILLLVWIILEG